MSSKFTDDEVERMHRMYESGFTYKDITNHFDISVPGVAYLLKTRHKDFKPRPKGRRPVPDLYIETMREMYDAGMTYQEIGNHYGIHLTTVGHALKTRSPDFKPRPMGRRPKII